MPDTYAKKLPAQHHCSQCGKQTPQRTAQNGICQECQRWNARLPGSYVLGNNYPYDEGFIKAHVCPQCPDKVCIRHVEKRRECVAVLKAKQEYQNKVYRLFTEQQPLVKTVQVELTV